MGAAVGETRRVVTGSRATSFPRRASRRSLTFIWHCPVCDDGGRILRERAPAEKPVGASRERSFDWPDRLPSGRSRGTIVTGAAPSLRWGCRAVREVRRAAARQTQGSNESFALATAGGITALRMEKGLEAQGACPVSRRRCANIGVRAGGVAQGRGGKAHGEPTRVTWKGDGARPREGAIRHRSAVRREQSFEG
jgi:hypothetical protein